MATTHSGFMPYERPPDLTKWESFKLMLWNPKEKAVLGRSAKSWGGIVFFYMCFYAGLAALFAICMQGLLYSLNDNTPRWQQGDGLIGNNPGMGFRPIAEDVENVGSLIWYDAADNASVSSWTHRIDEFLAPYDHQHKNQKMCYFNGTVPDGKVCKVLLSSFGDCSKEKDYGFRNSAPCFFIKLNRIIGWEPIPYDDPENLPADMPDSLKKHIATQPAEKRKVVWVSCAGENPADRENIGDVQYWPYQGIPMFYYPYINTENYMSPLVAVQLKRPVRHVLINIECRAWAKNIRYSKLKNEREGSVHLEVMVD